MAPVSTSQSSDRWRSLTCRWWRPGPSNQSPLRGAKKPRLLRGLFVLGLGDLLQRLLDASSEFVALFAKQGGLGASCCQLVPQTLDLGLELLHSTSRHSDSFSPAFSMTCL